MLKRTFLLFLIMLSVHELMAQLSLQGVIMGADSLSLQGANISLQKGILKRNARSDEGGNFIFKSLDPGNYRIIVSYAGYDEFVNDIRIDEKFVAQTFSVQMMSENHRLQNVEVLGRNARSYTSEYSFSATKVAVPIKDLPQSVSTITKELLADRQAFQLSDAVRMASGVAPASYYNQYTIRGISQNEEGQIINGMRTHQYYFLQPITSNIERVEVIKGPASATFASVDPGGSINIVTKKPLKNDRREVNMSVGSFSTIRGTLDFTGPLNKEKTLLYRLNAAYQEARSFRDLIGNKSVLLSPSITYLPNEKTAINAEMVFSNANGSVDRGQPIFGAVSGITTLNSTPSSLNLGAPNDFFKSRDFIIMGTFTHKFSNHMGFNASYMKQTWAEDLQEHRTTNAFGVNMNNQPVNSLAAMQFVQRKQFWNVDNLSTYFNFDFSTGKALHRLLAGFDKNNWQKLRGGGQNAARGYLLRDGSVAASFAPANSANYQTYTFGGVTLPRPNVPHFDLNNPNYTVRNAEDYALNVRTSLPAALTVTNAVYIQEQFSWRRFSVLASLRNEWFEDITNYKAPGAITVRNNVLLPRIGVTYAVLPEVNMYVTYLKGFQPQSNTVTLMPNTATLKAGAQFAPLESDLKEVGVKAGFFHNRITATAAAYRIRQKNILLNANVAAFPDSLITRGAERSQGIELDVAGFILPNWQLNASYSYIDAVIVQDNDASLNGARKQNTPRNSASLWTRYNFKPGTLLQNIGLGSGIQYSGDKVPWFTRAFVVPAYTLFDAALYYQPENSNVQLALNVNNLFDKTYWIGAQNYLRLFPGAPRNILLTLTTKF